MPETIAELTASDVPARHGELFDQASEASERLIVIQNMEAAIRVGERQVAQWTEILRKDRLRLAALKTELPATHEEGEASDA